MKKTIDKNTLRVLLDDRHYVEFVIDGKIYGAKRVMGGGRYLVFENHCIIKREESFLVAVSMFSDKIECTELYIDTIKQ